MDNIRKLILGGTGVAAAVLMATSTAYACTTYRGKMTATVTPGAGVSTVIGANGGAHNYCAANGPSGVIATAEKTAAGPAPIVVEIIVQPADNCLPPTTPPRAPNKLDAGVYDIDFRDNAGTAAPAYTGSYRTSWSSNGNPAGTEATTSCGPAQSARVTLGTMTVDSSGYGVGRATLPPSLRLSNTALGLPTDASALCVNAQLGQFDANGGRLDGDGNQVPLAVL